MYHFTGVIQKPVPYLQYVTTPLKVVKQDAVKVQQTINKPIPTLPKGVQSEASGFNGFGIAANRTSIYLIFLFSSLYSYSNVFKNR